MIQNLQNFFDLRENNINIFRDYSILIPEATKQNIKQNMEMKILSPEQMLQRLPIALAQVKVGNTSEDLLNKIRQIIYSLCREKEITRKVYNNIMNSKKL